MENIQTNKKVNKLKLDLKIVNMQLVEENFIAWVKKGQGKIT